VRALSRWLTCAEGGEGRGGAVPRPALVTILALAMLAVGLFAGGSGVYFAWKPLGLGEPADPLHSLTLIYMGLIGLALLLLARGMLRLRTWAWYFNVVGYPLNLFIALLNPWFRFYHHFFFAGVTAAALYYFSIEEVKAAFFDREQYLSLLTRYPKKGCSWWIALSPFTRAAVLFLGLTISLWTLAWLVVRPQAFERVWVLWLLAPALVGLGNTLAVGAFAMRQARRLESGLADRETAAAVVVLGVWLVGFVLWRSFAKLARWVG